jgi:indolepyruvate ferredoxin oxidoreductase beta subunit
MSADIATRPLTILIGALGGEGGGVLAEWLVDAAAHAGFVAQSTSIPGVAQRTGATTYYVEIFPVPLAALAERRPVLSLLPVPGCIDLVVASELLEAGRIMAGGMVSADRTLLIASTSRTLTTAEKMTLGDGRFDSDVLLAAAQRTSRRAVTFDMDAAAREAGTIVSAVMFGAIAGSGVLPLARADYAAVIDASERGAAASRKGFAAGWSAVADGVNPGRQGFDPAAPTSSVGMGSTSAGASAFDNFPLQVRDIMRLGDARMREFQDAGYAALYAQRLQRILAAERAADPLTAHGCALTRETARFLALWMAFDDIVRVAGLKIRASRFARVRAEVNAGPDDIVRIVDHFKPGMPEAAAMLPASLAARLLRWDQARQARGKAPLALALHLRTDNVAGFVALRMLAAMRGWRRRGTRYHDEQALIERWLAAVETAALDDWDCANELALCGRLVKGYGSTNERGKRNLVHIVDHLAVGGAFATPMARAAAIRAAREAALADEGGAALDRALVQHGAPARPLIAQPIRWTPRRAATPPRAEVSSQP